MNAPDYRHLARQVANMVKLGHLATAAGLIEKAVQDGVDKAKAEELRLAAVDR